MQTLTWAALTLAVTATGAPQSFNTSWLDRALTLATEAGAQQVPEASKQLERAKTEKAQAQQLAAKGDERASMVRARAEADANLALAIAQHSNSEKQAGESAPAVVVKPVEGAQLLTEATNAYHAAVNGPASKQPQYLRLADQQLREATAEQQKKGDTEHVQDLAYLALRNTELAQLMGNMPAEWSPAGEAAATATGPGGGLKQTEPGCEGSAGASAEPGVAGEERISISGNVLFPFGKSELIPPADERLSDVAQALKSEPDKRIRVEGFTDSTGPAQFNQELSVARAQAVKDYLVSQGVNADRIETEGNGPAKPVVDNSTAENRANNRRAAIIIEGEPGPSTP
jgi:outer membrane protein OmpA-like peptidoglycan-associated protein